jgi:signal transduction histidine kinase
LGSVAAAIGVLTVVIAGDGRWFALGDGSGTTVAVAVAASWALVAAGLVTWRRRPGNPIGPLATAAGLASFAPGLMGLGSGPAPLFTAALLVSALAVPLALHTALAHPSGRLGSPLERGAVGLAYLDAAILWPALALFTDPVDDGCFLCSRNLVGFLRDRATVEQLAGWRAWLGLAYGAAFVVLAVHRLLVSSCARRVLVAPVLAGGVVLAVVHAVASLEVIRSGFDSFGPEENARLLTGCVALALIAAGIGWGFARVRHTRAAVAELVAALDGSPAPGALRDELAHVLRDPTLLLAYWLPERAGYVDATGADTELPGPLSGRAVTEVHRAGERVAALVHDPSVHEDVGRVDELADTLRLAVEHERLGAAIHAQLDELRASRADIVAVGDAERRRLERNLHDGAQQRLLSLGLALQLAQAPPGPGPAAAGLVAEARRELEAAIADLRDVAHGIHPAVLTDDGLAAALATLAERARVPLVIDRVPRERLPEHVELTAYLIAAEAVANADAGPRSLVTLGIGIDGGHVIVDAEGDGIAGASRAEPGLEALSDRVAALGGHLDVTASPGGGARIRAELPRAGVPA